LRALVTALFNALLIRDSIEVSVYDIAWHQDVYQRALEHFGGTGKFSQYMFV